MWGTSEQHRWLADFCGRDEERPELRHPFLDGDRMVATDGHRLLAVRRPPGSDEKVTGYVHRAALRAGDFAPLLGWEDLKPPPWRTLLPASGQIQHVATLRVPRWLRGIERLTEIAVAVTGDGEFSLGRPATGRSLVLLNMWLLRPLAGWNLRLGITGSHSPVIIVPDGGDPGAPLDADWFAMQMPLNSALPVLFGLSRYEQSIASVSASPAPAPEAA